MENVVKKVIIELIEGTPLYRVYPVIVEFAKEYGRHIYIEQSDAQRDSLGRAWMREVHVANHEQRERECAGNSMEKFYYNPNPFAMITISQHTHDSESPLWIEGNAWHDYGIVERIRRCKGVRFVDVPPPYEKLRGALEEAEQVFHWPVQDFTDTGKVSANPFVPQEDLEALTRLLSKVIEGPHT